MSELLRLAEAVGLQPTWDDYLGQRHIVNEDSLRHILRALGYETGSSADVSASLQRGVTAQRLIIGVAGQQVQISAAPGRAQLRLETGAARAVLLLDAGPDTVSFSLPDECGYHVLEVGTGIIPIAVAPLRAMGVADIAAGEKLWGAAAQLYSLNNGGAIGKFADAGLLCAVLARYGADALAVSPTHALFAADPSFYAPYSPSTRLFLNPVYAPRESAVAGVVDGLIDWRTAAGAQWTALRGAYQAFVVGGDGRAEFDRFVRDGGDALLAHARFEALDARFRVDGLENWRDWPSEFSEARSQAVQALSPCDRDIEIHLFVQWRADCGMRDAQAAARGAGMRIGLITDLAVGMQGHGSQGWSTPEAVLQGISIGAPPDLLSSQGQSWGLTSFSPVALRQSGFAPFLATLRAVMRHAGGVRIDHALGLQRLWVIPDGGGPAEGAYLRYPVDDMLKLIALESWRHRVIVIGEDLGTIPADFRDRCTAAGMAGMRVLWFERTADGGFIPPYRWDERAVGMTTTHDLPTVAGWWQGRDIAWRAAIDDTTDEKLVTERKLEAAELWQAMLDSGAASGDTPRETQTDAVVDAAIAHVAASACDLVLIAMEDLLGLEEQPNLPGTIDQHPNWRRRLPPGNGLSGACVHARLERMNEIRKALVQ